MNNRINISKNPLLNNSYSKVSIQKPALNSEKLYSNSYGIKENINIDKSISVNNHTPEYVGMDGKVYYDKNVLDFANKAYLEEKNKGN